MIWSMLSVLWSVVFFSSSMSDEAVIIVSFKFDNNGADVLAILNHN